MFLFWLAYFALAESYFCFCVIMSLSIAGSELSHSRSASAWAPFVPRAVCCTVVFLVWNSCVFQSLYFDETAESVFAIKLSKRIFWVAICPLHWLFCAAW